MKRWIALAVIIAGTCMPASVAAQVRGFGLSETAEQAERQRAGDPPAPWTIESAIAAMSLRERVAQLLMVTMQGRLAPDASERQLIEAYTPGAAIIANVTRPRSGLNYAAALQRNPVQNRHGVPMLIGADLAELPVVLGANKGGFFAPLPSMLAVAAANDPAATRELADLYAEHLAAMGFSFQAGPSLALAPELPEAKGGLQCLGADPAFVGETAEIFLDAFRKRELAVLFTGFPGGAWNFTGDAPPVLLTPATAMASRDLIPYQRAVMAGARMLLVGNILTPHLDKEHAAASLSPKVMKELLRDELLYPGIVVAGPIDGLTALGGATQGDAAVAALRAGADMLLWQRSGIHVMKAAETIVRAVENGDLPESTINTSVTRLLQLKEDLGLRTREMPSEREADRLEKRRAYPQAAQRIERRSVTIVQNNNAVLPLSRDHSVPVGITGVIGVPELYEPLNKELKHVAQQRIATARHGGEIYKFEIHRLTSRAGGVRTVVIVLTNEIRPQGKVELIRKFKQQGSQVVVVLVGYPHTLGNVREADAIVVMYSDPAASSAAMSAVAEALLGKSAIAMRPPEEPLQLAVGEPVEFDAMQWLYSPAGRLPVSIEPVFEAGVGHSILTFDAIRRVRWEFGDGGRARQRIVQHTYKAPGNYTVTLSATDAAGQTTSGLLHVEVTD